MHLLCGGHPKLSVGSIVNIFKSIMAREILLRKPSVKKELWGGAFWTDGNYVATVGERAGRQWRNMFKTKARQKEISDSYRYCNSY